MQTETESHFVQHRADKCFRRGVFAADATHIPRAALFGEAVFVHVQILSKRNGDGKPSAVEQASDPCRAATRRSECGRAQTFWRVWFPFKGLNRNDAVEMGSAGRWPAVLGGSPNPSSHHFFPHWTVNQNSVAHEVFDEPSKTARGPRAPPRQLHRSGLKVFPFLPGSWPDGTVESPVLATKGLPGAFVEIDFHVFGATAGGNDVQLSIAIEVGQAQVFARHGVVVDQRLFPIPALVVEWSKQLDAHFDVRFSHRAPADHDLIAAQTGQVSAGQGVTQPTTLEAMMISMTTAVATPASTIECFRRANVRS